MVEHLPTSGPPDDCHLELLAHPRWDAARVWGNATQTVPPKSREANRLIEPIPPRGLTHTSVLGLSVRCHYWRRFASDLLGAPVTEVPGIRRFADAPYAR